jgi:hypothetical protein
MRPKLRDSRRKSHCASCALAAAIHTHHDQIAEVWSSASLALKCFFPYLRPTAQALPPRELHQRLQELVASLPELAGGMSTDGRSDRVGHGYGCSLPLFRIPVPFIYVLISLCCWAKWLAVVIPLSLINVASCLQPH